MMRLSATVAAAGLLVASAQSDVYRLNWVGDYQTGDFDTDAAENIAHDVDTQRVFVASAEAGVVQVVDISDPTHMTEVGTLNVGANLAQYCQIADCIYEQMDFG